MFSIGFDTIGNATVIAYDGEPILVTDPWITDNAYFGSWTLSHVIPPEQMEAIRKCKYVWVSHGHPDHLNGDSIQLLRDKQILMADHVGGRIYHDLVNEGYNVKVLKDKTWTPLSPHIKVMTIADFNQDSVILIDINGTLLVNTNDAGANKGWGGYVKKVVKDYPISFLLALTGYGDADMINFYDEQGNFLEPLASKKLPVGRDIANLTSSFGVNYFVPFSSMHRFQREDSVWASQYTTGLDDYEIGFESDTCELLPAFLRYDCVSHSYEKINPAETPARVRKPEEFGDNWGDLLEAEDFRKAEQYFKSFEKLHSYLDFINLRVGGKDNVIEFKKQQFQRGITFEVPRNSLMTSVNYEIFDDLLIGNFMKTTLHGKWPNSKLYPDFAPYVTKYGDNGKARTEEELHQYFKAYRQRDPLSFLHAYLENKAKDTFRSLVKWDNPLYRTASRVYWYMKA